MLDGHRTLEISPSSSPASVSERLPSLHVVLAAPRGFCAGVRRAIDAVVDALDRHGAPVYVRRPIVHNQAVVASLEAQGAVFVQELDEVPKGAVVILSAHGVAPQIIADAKRRKLIAYDAVCPLVAKVHREVSRYKRGGRHVVLIGHAGHPEVVGTLGHVPPGAATLVKSAQEVRELDLGSEAPLGYAVQTTYSVEEAGEVIGALRSRFSDLAGPPSSDICYATTNRQRAVRVMAPRVSAMIVAGEHFSSNACRLAEVAKASGCPSVQLVSDASKIEWEHLPADGSVGITAAASTPEIIVSGILDALRARYCVRLEEVSATDERVDFKPVKIG